MNKFRLIAFYLPQYHPIPENDHWWGKGFTEWTNVVKAKPLFRGHYQPHIPADLGFYDLRVPEIREAQADMAREYFIEGFCYWHYWFGNGKMLLERPFQEVLQSGKPNFPFCLAWANVTWTGEWKGKPSISLIQQKYPGIQDHKNHFDYLLPAFEDDRYIRINGKPIFYIHKPLEIPEVKIFIETWKQLAIKSGLEGLYFIANNLDEIDASEIGFDGFSFHFPDWITLESYPKFKNKIVNNCWMKYRRRFNKPAIYNYTEILKEFDRNFSNSLSHIPLVIPNWDNTPRVGSRGVVLQDSTPEAFRDHLNEIINNIKQKPHSHRIIFIKSWNEWAEGNHLEPDQKFGKAYLEVLREENVK